MANATITHPWWSPIHILHKKLNKKILVSCWLNLFVYPIWFQKVKKCLNVWFIFAFQTHVILPKNPLTILMKLSLCAPHMYESLLFYHNVGWTLSCTPILVPTTTIAHTYKINDTKYPKWNITSKLVNVIQS